MRWAAVGVLLFTATSSLADITIGGGVLSPPVPEPVAVPDFSVRNASDRQMGHELADIVARDLSRSNRFNALGSDRFKSVDLMGPPWTNDPPPFDQWKLMNMQALLQAEVEVQGDKISVQFHLWDIYAGSQMMTQTLRGPITGKRRVAHLIANAVYRRLTGSEGYFDSLIAYVSENGPTIRPVTRLAVMDPDGGNQRYLTDGRDLVLLPRISPNLRDIAYLSIGEGGRAKITLYHFANQQTESFDEVSGVTSAPSFSPNGTKLVVSSSRLGDSNIYEIDLRSRQARRLTEGEWLDTAPSYSPDGAKLVFSSNRQGTEQLYVMNADGSQSHRISFGNGSYGAPAWSPRGNRIAFSKLEKDRAYVGFMSLDGTGERLLAEGTEIGSPAWAPNGQAIVYERRNTKGSKLICVDVDDHGEVPIPTPEGAAEPSWSALFR